jgi:amino acid permease
MRMELSNWWIAFGVMAYSFGFANLLKALTRKTEFWELYMFISLTGGLMAMLSQYQLVSRWVKTGDWTAIEDVMPFMSDTLIWLVLFGVLLNVIALIINLSRQYKAGQEKQR